MSSNDSKAGHKPDGLRRRLGYVGKRLKKLGSWSTELCTPSSCDVVIQFPKDSLTFTIEWLSHTITTAKAGVVINIRKHETTGLTNMLCSCSFQGLLKGAEELLLKKRLKQEYGGQLRDFFLEDAIMYENIEDPELFFSSQERQQILLHILNNIRLCETQKVQGHLMLEGQPIVPKLVTTRLIKQIYPLHSLGDLEKLRKGWVFHFTSFQPLDAIKDYFGVHIGMYFAFLGHYTMALTVPAVIGVLIWLTSGANQVQDDLSFVVFALLNVIWSTIYIELWKRREAEQAFKWGTLDKQDDLITEPRPLYTGKLIQSSVTGRLEPHFPRWRRSVFFYTVSLPVMFLCHCVIVLVCFNFFTLYDIINKNIDSGHLYFVFKPIPNIFLAAAVMIMDKVYGMIAVWLNDRENYRNDEEYKNQLIIKLMVFQSANSFLSLFYTAFYIQDFNRLKNQLAVLFVVRQIVGNMKESLLSFCIAKIKQQQGAEGATTGVEIFHKLSKECVSTVSHDCHSSSTTASELKSSEVNCDQKSESSLHSPSDETDHNDLFSSSTDHTTSSGVKLTQAESEGLLPQYDGTFEDYLEMVIQFSYVTWFSSVFPLAGLFALLNNIVEIRSDAFKICMSYQRPVGERVRNIGAWQTVLEVMSIGTIIVNTALIGISGPMQRLFPDLSNIQRLLLIVVIEHVVLAIKYIIRVAISEVPEWVSVEMAKLEFSRREALRSRLQDQFNELNETKGLHSHSTSTSFNAQPELSLGDNVVETQSGLSSCRSSPHREPAVTDTGLASAPPSQILV